MKYYIFLDDERNPTDVFWVRLPVPENWVIVRSQYDFERAIDVAGLHNIVHISFDNDLGTNMGSGFGCVQWMVDEVLDGRQKWNHNFTYTVHSKNNIAEKQIIGLLNPFIRLMNANRKIYGVKKTWQSHLKSFWTYLAKKFKLVK